MLGLLYRLQTLMTPNHPFDDRQCSEEIGKWTALLSMTC
jgi:hypothetical protein